MSVFDGASPQLLRHVSSLENRVKSRDRTIERLNRALEDAEAKGFDDGVAYAVRDVFSIIDDVYRVYDQSRPLRGRGAKAAVLEGIRVTLNNAKLALERLGISRVNTVGPVDYSCMEAIATVPIPNRTKGDVVETLRRGYTRDGQVLRPAQVVVAGSDEHHEGGLL